MTNELLEVIEELYPNSAIIKSLHLNQSLIDELLKYESNDGKCYVTQKELSENIGISQTYVSKMLHRLQRTDKSIENIDKGIYRVNHPILIENGLYKKIIEIFAEICLHPEIAHLPYKKQSEMFKMTIKELQTVYGYLYALAGELKKKNNEN